MKPRRPHTSGPAHSVLQPIKKNSGVWVPVIEIKTIHKLPWFRRNVYDNVEEFYVVIKEKVSREQQQSQEEIHRKIGNDSHQQSKNRDAYYLFTFVFGFWHILHNLYIYSLYINNLSILSHFPKAAMPIQGSRAT